MQNSIEHGNRRDYTLFRKYKLRFTFEKEPALCEQQRGSVLEVEETTCTTGSEAGESLVCAWS